ncbi:MAG: hypothetical protein KDK99_09655, partial [Verrucomicrobiales bacterium]|nr:hypothetical protein [Verrucomicrobiales bacterium]
MEPSSRLTTLAVTLSLVVLVGVMAWMGWMAVGGGAGEKRVQTVETMPRAPVSRPSPRPTVTRAEPAVSSASPPQSAETASAEDAALEQLQEALSAPGTIPGEVVLTFRSPTALAAFRARAGLQGLRIVDSDARLLAARVAYRDWEDLARELRGHGEDYAEAGPNFQAWIPGLPPEQPGVDAENAGGREPFREGALAAIGAVGDRSTWGRGVTVAL